ncbi:MAG: multiheme c-type cytochrome [Nanoarchaeota archaeon]|nr:multiheme c-type cytochrome [Nanoarchaeota archaeon]
MKSLTGAVLAAALSASCVEVLATIGAGTVAYGVVSVFSPSSSQYPPEEEMEHHDYVGVDRCGNARCHGSGRLGNQMAVWEASAHARAYEILSSSEALDIGAPLGIISPQRSDECLRCHQTAYNVSSDNLRESFNPTRGVQCESCHGPGADYSSMRIMSDRDQAIANGLLIPDEQTCRNCHNEESPTYRGFNFKEYLGRIRHPLPEEGTGEGE